MPAWAVVCYFAVVLVPLAIPVRAQPIAPKWTEWRQRFDMFNYHFHFNPGEEFPEDVSRACESVFHITEDCVDYHLRVYRRNRVMGGAKAGMSLRLRKLSCRSLPIKYGSHNELTINLNIGLEDDPLYLANAICNHMGLNSSQLSSIMEVLVPQLKEQLHDLSSTNMTTLCIEADLRKKMVQSVKSLSIGSILPPETDTIPVSRVKCKYPFKVQEQLLVELAGMRPLGSCKYQNLYMHNNEWYFVSDSPNELPIEGVRLHTMLRNKNYKDILKPKHMTIDAMRAAVEDFTERWPREFRGQHGLKIFPHTLFLISRLVLNNHGHAIFDVVLPIIWSVLLHAKESDEGIGIGITDIKEAADFLMSQFGDLFRIVLMDSDDRDAMDDRLRLITPLTGPIYNFDYPLGFLCPAGSWCVYDTVYAGVGGMGVDYQLSQSKDREYLYSVLRQRAAVVFEYPNVAINKDFTDSSSYLYIVIVQRFDWRAFSEDVLLAIQELILEQEPKAVVNVVQFELKSLEEQLRMMQNVSILLAVDGAAIDNALFAPPCTGLFVIGRDIDHPFASGTSSNFEMHETHFSTWQQWLSITLHESEPGSWTKLTEHRRHSGPLGDLPVDSMSRQLFRKSFSDVLEKRKVCAMRYYGVDIGPLTNTTPETFLKLQQRHKTNEFDKNHKSYGINECDAYRNGTEIKMGKSVCFCISPSHQWISCQPHGSGRAHVSRSRLVPDMKKLRTYLEPTYDIAGEDALVSVTLIPVGPSPICGSSPSEYAFSYFVENKYISNDVYINEIYHIMQPHLSKLFRERTVSIINGEDGYVSLLSLINGAKKITAYISDPNKEPSITNVLKKINGVFEVMLKSATVFPKAVLYNLDDPNFRTLQSDTTVLLGGIWNLFDCDGVFVCGTEFRIDQAISILASITKERLLFEFYPYISCDGARGSSFECNHNHNCTSPANFSLHPEVHELETTLRKYFVTFQVIGAITSIDSGARSLLYMAENPLASWKSYVSEQTVQAIVLSPSNGSVLQVTPGNDLIQVQCIMSGPEYLLFEFHEHIQNIELQKNDGESSTSHRLPLLIPRLFVNNVLFAVPAVTPLGNNLLLSYYHINISAFALHGEPVDIEISFQLLKNSDKQLKSQSHVPEKICQSTVLVTLLFVNQ